MTEEYSLQSVLFRVLPWHCSVAFFRVCLRLLLVWVAAIATDCGSTGPTGPQGGSARYEGQWSGVTSQGRTISFTVSPDQKVTTITLGYSFNGCTGTSSFPNLNLIIASGPSPGSPTPGPGFGYGSGPPDGPNYIQVYGAFSSYMAATGSVAFGDFSGCGNGGGIWTATKN
jgi:hypothetical protein